MKAEEIAGWDVATIWFGKLIEKIYYQCISHGFRYLFYGVSTQQLFMLSLQ
jgi:hypothetical protein